MFFSKIDLIQIDSLGWTEISSESDIIQWRSEKTPAILSLNYFRTNTDIPCKLSDRDGIIKAYAGLTSRAGGIALKVDVIDVDNVPSIETIMKFPSSNEMYYYIGTITIPFKKFSFTIKVESAEDEKTDDREDIILKKLLSDKTVKRGNDGNLTGWFKKPLIDSQNSKTKANLADEEKYDREFPNHPLSIVRSSLKKIKKTVELDEKLSKYDLF